MASWLTGKGLRRLTMDMGVEIHADIKARAAFRHTSMKNYILEAVAMRMLREDEFNKSQPPAKVDLLSV